MVSALLDTSVIIDLLRGYPPARLWNRTQSNVGVCRAVWLEVIEGVENRQKQQIAIKLLNGFELIELTTEDIVWATEQLIALNLGHSMDSFDCMIASVNHRLQVPLYTRNMKHFKPLLGSLAESPY